MHGHDASMIIIAALFIFVFDLCMLKLVLS
jgi:hypothetical protein